MRDNLIPGGKIGARKAWKFRNADFAKLFGVSEDTLRRWTRDGVLDRSDLKSVVTLFDRRKK